MKQLHIKTKNLADWQSRLADPKKHWKRGASALECAVSWELASRRESGLPLPIENALNSVFEKSKLLLGIAEHKVKLPGGSTASQNDVWGIVETDKGMLSLAVEAKANEAFGKKLLKDWRKGSGPKLSAPNREKRWDFLSQNLPSLPEGQTYDTVRYQLLHRCASAVIEAKRFGFPNAAMIVQQFPAKKNHHADYKNFCKTIGVKACEDQLQQIDLGEIQLYLGWINCQVATDKEIFKLTSKSK